MSNPTLQRKIVAAAVVLLVVTVVGAAAAVAGGLWGPKLLAFFVADAASSDDPHAHEHDEHDHAADDPNVLELSPQARETLGIRVAPLKRSDYERTIRIPGQVVKIPGVTEIELTARSSGEIEGIRVLEGKLVKPGAALFDIQLIHEEAIKNQLELLDALAKLEVVNAEIARLEKLLEESPGAVPGTRLLTQRYERGHVEHTIESRRQILTLLGLPSNDIEALIQRHQMHHSITRDPDDGDEHEHDDEPPLLERMIVYAPRGIAGTADEQPTYVMEELSARMGQHVDVGDTLCRLGDYRQLYIEGHAFERDLGIVRRGMQKGWKATAAVERRQGGPVEYEGMPIVYIDSTIDPQTRSARFFVELNNALFNRTLPPETSTLDTSHSPLVPQLSTLDSQPSSPAYADWQWKPGQRVELRIPIEKFAGQLIVPAEAVASEGLDNYVFQVSGDIFVRRPVSVLYQDEERVVLNDDGSVFEGMSVAMNGAYQLQLALLNRASGPVQHDHGGGAHSH